MFVAFAVGLGEWVWIGFVFYWAVRLTYLLYPRWPMTVPFLVGAVVLGLHFGGLKFYGSPHMRDNRPVLSGQIWTLANVESPNVLIATDGSRHMLKGCRFIDLQARKEYLPYLLSSLHEGHALEFIADSKAASGYATERRVRYFCGNTFFPHFFPRVLPKYTSGDVVEELRPVIRCEVAVTKSK